MKPTRSTSRAIAQKHDHTAAMAFLAGVVLMLAGMWWLQDGKPGIATPAGIITAPN